MHRKALERRVKRFIDSNAYGSRREDNVDAGERRWRVEIHRKPPVVAWGALIGDSLFNFRSALDHLIYDLSVAHTGSPLPPDIERQCEFPIFWTRKPSSSEIKRRIGGVHPDARKIISDMQPYGRKDRAALKYLDGLQNFDKHRTLLLTVGTSTGLAHFGDMELSAGNFLSPLKDNDVIAAVRLTDPEANQDPVFSFGVAFENVRPSSIPPNIDWMPPDVVTTLGWIGQHIEKSVIPPLLPFL
jgi:hypothetical protein